MNTVQLEICCGDLQSVLAAKEGGAERIELCSGLSEGGLTPSYALIEAAVETGIPNVNVLIRPRPGDFLYTEREIALMERDIEYAVAAGATGVVVGCLNADGSVDTADARRLVEAARKGGRNTYVTFHRAFDVAADHVKSLEDIIALGCDCLLTSGMAPNAAKGIPMLREICRLADGRITVMAGSGVNAANAADIISATGVGAIHSTARKPVPSRMVFRRATVAMGAPGMDEYAPLSTSPETVAQIKKTTK